MTNGWPCHGQHRSSEQPSGKQPDGQSDQSKMNEGLDDAYPDKGAVRC